MKKIVAALFVMLVSAQSLALDFPLIVQIKYSPWGGINADEDEFDTDDEFEHYDMTFDNSYGGRILMGPVYISHHRSNADIEGGKEAEVRTIAIGVAGISYDVYQSQSGTYLMGGLGIGRGTFIFDKEDGEKEQDAMFEANAEAGLRIDEHLLIGAGLDFQHFGEFGESKGSAWTFYISSGLVF
ncbi:MAG TPA: hypothetical protein VLC79_16360 [Cellvibrio sp.]|nr:hypothetical protein [Cellvibrio sp.]